MVAGRSLAAEGSHVTGWALRRVVGRGDPGRLQAVWWNQRQAEVAGDVEAAASATPLPPVEVEVVEAMQGKVGDLAGELWRAAERLAVERVQGEAEAARAESASLRHELDQAAAVLTAADEAREAAEERAERLAAQEAEAARWYEGVESRVAAAEARATAAEAETRRVREDLRAALDAVGRVKGKVSGVTAG